MVLLSNAIRDVVVNREGRFYRAVTTTDATVTTAWKMSVLADTTLTLELSIAAYSAGATQGAAYWKRAAVKRVGTALPVLIGAVQTVAADIEDDATWDATFALDGAGSITATVTGAVGKSIAWNVGIHALEAPWQSAQ